MSAIVLMAVAANLTLASLSSMYRIVAWMNLSLETTLSIASLDGAEEGCRETAPVVGIGALGGRVPGGWHAGVLRV